MEFLNPEQSIGNQEVGNFILKMPEVAAVVAKYKSQKFNSEDVTRAFGQAVYDEVKKDPKGFMKQVANIEHNITRYRSQINKDKMTDEKRTSIARNLANAERMHELMMQVVKE